MALSTSSEEPKADPPLSPELLAELARAEVFDAEGRSFSFADLTAGKRVLVVLTRHFWCGNCRVYTEHLNEGIPPPNLPDGTSIIIIGPGQPSAIPRNQSQHSLYPVYANPSLSLYTALGCSRSTKGSPAGAEKAYEAELGGQWTRAMRSVVKYALPTVGQVGRTGPVALNGGEMLFEADGSCAYLHLMRNSSDHTDVHELAEIIGARYTPRKGEAPGDETRAAGKDCGCD